MADYDDERPSWREIDRRRDRSRHVRSERDKRDTSRVSDRWKSGRVKEALERLFKGEKGTLEHDRLHAKLHETYGTDKFLPAVKAYLEKYGMPDDLSTLLLFLDARDEAILWKTLEKVREVLPTLRENEKEDLVRKLKILSVTMKSKEMRSQLKEITSSL
jgi:hypothetical protein